MHDRRRSQVALLSLSDPIACSKCTDPQNGHVVCPSPGLKEGRYRRVFRVVLRFMRFLLHQQRIQEREGISTDEGERRTQMNCFSVDGESNDEMLISLRIPDTRYRMFVRD